MATIQQLRHGNGQGWDSSHTERMHQYFFTRIGGQTQRRSSTFAKQVANRLYEITTIDACIDKFQTQLLHMETEQYSGEVDDKHLFFDNQHELGNNGSASINTPKFSYYDSDLPAVSRCDTSGKYTLSFDPQTNDITKIDVNWKDSVAQKAKKPLHKELLYALLLHAQTNNWRGLVNVEGHTCVKKFDITTGNTIVYQSDALFHGRSVNHWALFNFEDDRRPDDTLNAGMILGFMRFTGIKEQNDGLHVVARCSPVYQNFDKKIITDVTLIPGKESIYFIPVKDLIGPLCVVPNIHNLFRMRQDIESWLAIMPRRKWGRRFGDSIDW